MPRPDTVAHDLDLDSRAQCGTPDGKPRMIFGKMNPKTGVFLSMRCPPVPPGDLPGARDIQVDRGRQHLGFAADRQRAVVLTKYNPKTEECEHHRGSRHAFMALGPERQNLGRLDAD